jgi:hypothetical protein
MEKQSNSRTNRDGGEVRPYRSHLCPACLLCRKRKSRCRTRDSSGICMMCQAHGTNCIYPQPDDSFQRRSIASPRKLAAKSRQAPRSAAPPCRNPSNTGSHPSPQTIPPLANPDSTPRDIDQRLARRLPASLEASSYPPNNEDYNREETLPNLVGLVAEVGDNSSHIVSPAVAEDNEILETYLSTIPDARRRYIVRTNPNSSRPVRPVLFNTVPRRPLGVSANQSLQAMALPIAECHIGFFSMPIYASLYSMKYPFGMLMLRTRRIFHRLFSAICMPTLSSTGGTRPDYVPVAARISALSGIWRTKLSTRNCFCLPGYRQ